MSRNAPQPAAAENSGGLYLPEIAAVRRVADLTPLDRLLEIELPGGRRLGHRPGQFVQVSLFGFGEAPISVCSSPAREGGFELCVRKLGGLTGEIHRLREGDPIGIRGPFGKGFPLDCLVKMDALIIAGGIGLAPLRSVIQTVLAHREQYGRLIVLYGARAREDILFSEEIEAWRRGARNEIHVTVDEGAPDWEGHVGVVTTLLPHVEIDPGRTVVVASVGPPVMYRAVLAELLELGVPEQQIYFSLERRMKCGVGKCGHCQVDDRYVCMDGPVFPASEIGKMRESI